MAMFSSLSEKLENAFKKFRSRGKLTEADVNFKVVKDFVRIVSERAVGTEVMESLMPGQQIVKIVDEELTRLMGGSQSKLEIAPKPPTIVMMVGLQGAGKTTHAGKLAGMYRSRASARCWSPATCTVLPQSGSWRCWARSWTSRCSRWATGKILSALPPRA